MIYTTTKCPHCGYKTRNRQTNLPESQLGQTILSCPNCKEVIIDPINTEWEFMTNDEKKKFSQDSIKSKNIMSTLAKVIVAIMFFIGGIITGETSYIVIGIIFAGVFIWSAISETIKNNELIESGVIKKEIEESILRTSNKDYVAFLEKYYEGDRVFHKAPERETIIQKNKEKPNENIKNFNEFIKIITKENKEEIKESKHSTSQINL